MIFGEIFVRFFKKKLCIDSIFSDRGENYILNKVFKFLFSPFNTIVKTEPSQKDVDWEIWNKSNSFEIFKVPDVEPDELERKIFGKRKILRRSGIENQRRRLNPVESKKNLKKIRG